MDLYEGDDQVRQEVCDWAGHVWIAGQRWAPEELVVETCEQCGATRMAQEREAG